MYSLSSTPSCTLLCILHHVRCYVYYIVCSTYYHTMYTPRAHYTQCAIHAIILCRVLWYAVSCSIMYPIIQCITLCTCYHDGVMYKRRMCCSLLSPTSYSVSLHAMYSTTLPSLHAVYSTTLPLPTTITYSTAPRVCIGRRKEEGMLLCMYLLLQDVVQRVTSNTLYLCYV